MVESDNLLYVNDAASTEMWSAMPEVVENGVNSYLGLPIHWPQGDVFGTLCLKDNKETNYTNEYFELINQLRDLIEDDLALVYNFEKMREIAMLDALTNIYNRRALSLLAQQKLNLSHRLGFDACCLFIDINDFKKLNDSFGHDAGDAALREFGILLNDIVTADNIACRIGGEEFVLMLTDTDEQQAIEFSHHLLANIRQ